VKRTFGIVEDRRRDGAAEIDVEAGPAVLVIGIGESRHALRDAALDVALALHFVERLGRRGRRGKTDRCAERHSHDGVFHSVTFPV
jgi:hypothetical protein